MKVQIAKWGNSAAVRLPKTLLDRLGAELGSTLELTVKGESIVLSPARKRLTIEDIVAEMKRLGPQNEPELVDWGPDVGAEIIDDEYSRNPREDWGSDDGRSS